MAALTAKATLKTVQKCRNGHADLTKRTLAFSHHVGSNGVGGLAGISVNVGIDKVGAPVLIDIASNATTSGGNPPDVTSMASNFM